MRQGRLWTKVSNIDVCPGLDDGHYLVRGHVCQSDVMRRRERNDIAFSGDGFCAEQTSGQRSIFALGVVLLLLLFHCTVVVDEDEGALELGVLFTIRARVPRAQIALSRVSYWWSAVAQWSMYLLVILWERGFGRRFLKSSAPMLTRAHITGPSIAHCQGRLLRCGETSTQLPRNRLNLRCEMSLRMGPDMAGRVVQLSPQEARQSKLINCASGRGRERE